MNGVPPPEFVDAVYDTELIRDRPGNAAGRSEPPRGRLAIESSTSCSTHRTARLPMRSGFGKRDSDPLAQYVPILLLQQLANERW